VSVGPHRMNREELERRLFVEGCNPSLYAVGSRAGASDAFCLVENHGRWSVFYTERGEDSTPIFASTSEEDACEFFLRHITSMRHFHCVGFFSSEARAQSLRSELQARGVASSQDRVPFGGPQDPRFRVFVEGKAVFKAREVLGEIPVRD
jgi:hypothetical protein